MEINAIKNRGKKSFKKCLYLIKNYVRRVPNVNEKIKKVGIEEILVKIGHLDH